MSSSHERHFEAASAYALGTLDSSEREAFEAHLATCPTCRDEVAAYRDVAAMLATAVPLVEPSNREALRRRILQEAERVRPLPMRTAASSHARAPRETSGVRGGSWRVAPWLAAAAGLAFAIVSGLAYRNERAAREQLALDLAMAREDLAFRDSTIAAFLGPEVHVVSLSAPEQKPTARVFWNHTRNLFIVTAHNLPPAPEGKTYQLWAIRKGKEPLSMGTFNTDASGRVTALIPVGMIADAGFIDNCALTVEPAGGSPAPTEEPRLIGAWRHVD